MNCSVRLILLNCAGMKILARLKKNLPAPSNIFFAILSAILLIFAFPDFEFWFFAWFALIPFLYAVYREKDSAFASFILGWFFGIVFFFGTCWWLTFAPITYAKFPAPLAYFLLLCATLVVGLFPAVFAALFSFSLKRIGDYAIFSAPFIWTAIEFLRFWATGNNWNAVAYSQAFNIDLIQVAGVGGIYLLGFQIIAFNSAVFLILLSSISSILDLSDSQVSRKNSYIFSIVFILLFSLPFVSFKNAVSAYNPDKTANVIAVQPNVPMSGLTSDSLVELKKKHVELSEAALKNLNERQPSNDVRSTTVIFPESPMNFMYEYDEEFQKFVGDFARKNNVAVLFNAAEPDAENKMFFNSAVLVNADGRKIAQYDKIYLVPFGESVPAPLQNFLPALVGSFSYGKEYDLLPFGDARGGVMICFESHFPNLSREYVRRGADVLIEMTNDGYLGNTPVLRQHLANAVFRAVETGRPVLRVTNVGVTAYINERGEISDSADVYAEATRTWTISKSNGEQTFYVKYGDWFAWLCVIASFVLILVGIISTQRRKGAKTRSF